MAKRLPPKRRQAASGQDRPAWMVPAIATGVALFVAGLIFLLIQSAVPSESVAATATPFQEIAGVEQAEAAPGRAHDDVLQYEFEELPPWGGTHSPIWQNCGIYQNPVRPENAIHSLEHGAVWITYQPDMAENDVEAVREQIRDRSFVLMSPYPNQRSPLILTAWGVRLELDSVTDERIERFVDYFEAGPQTPEPGAACQGGLSFTVEDS